MTDYVAAFSQSRSPAATFHPTSLRLSLQRQLTSDLSLYFHERCLIEDQYVKSLQRLSSRLHGQASKDVVFKELDQLTTNQGQQDLQLGQLSQLRRQLEQELSQIARAHETYKSKCQREVEMTLKSSLEKEEWIRWNQQEREFANQVKEYESLVEKVQKAQSKSTKSSKSSGPSSKLLSLQSSLSSLGSTLTSTLPQFLHQSQQLDSSHVRSLKECLIKSGTLESDLGRERMEMGESLVVRVLEVEEETEMETWALREGMKASGGGNGVDSTTMGEFGGAGRTREESYNTTTRSIADTESLAPSTTRNENSSNNNNTRERTVSRLNNAPPPAPLPLPTTDDTSSLHSTNNTREKTSRGGLFGKKNKLANLLSGGGSSSKDKDREERGGARDRTSSIPNSARYSSFNGGGGSSAPSNNDTTSFIDGEQRQNRGGEGGGLAPPGGTPTLERRDTDGSDLLGSGGGDGGGMMMQAPLSPSSNTTTTPKNRNSMFPSMSSNSTPSNNNNNENGGGNGGGGSGGIVGNLFRRQSRMNSFGTGGGESSPSLQQQQSTLGGGSSNYVSEEPHQMVDSDGFTVPPKGYDRAIGQSSMTTTNTNATGTGGSRNLMDDDDDDDEEDSRPLGESVPKLSILPPPTSTSFATSSSSPALPVESEADRLAALSSLKNSLGAPPTSASGGLGRRVTARGRRSDVTTGSSSAKSESSTMMMNTTPAKVGLAAGAGAAAAAGGVGAASLVRKDTDDDIPLATIQQQQQQSNITPSPVTTTTTKRREAPPPPVSANNNSIASTAPLSPPLSSMSPSSYVSTPGRAMSILSTNSSIGGGSSILASTNAPLSTNPFEGITEPGLRVSIVETVNALLKGGEVTKVLVTGQVSIHYVPPRDDGDDDEPIRFKLLNVGGVGGGGGEGEIEKLVPNSNWIKSTSQRDVYEFVSPRSFHEQNQGKTVPVIKYQLGGSTLTKFVPLMVKPSWRCEPNLTRIIVVYHSNPSFTTTTSSNSLTASTSSPFGDEQEPSQDDQVDVTNLHLQVPFTPGQVSTFQSKPSNVGTIVSSSGHLDFNLSNSTTTTKEEKLLISVQTESSTAKPGPISIGFNVKDRTIGRVGIEIVGPGEVEDDLDEDEGRRAAEKKRIVEIKREIISGKYVAA